MSCACVPLVAIAIHSTLGVAHTVGAGNAAEVGEAAAYRDPHVWGLRGLQARQLLLLACSRKRAPNPSSPACIHERPPGDQAAW